MGTARGFRLLLPCEKDPVDFRFLLNGRTCVLIFCYDSFASGRCPPSQQVVRRDPMIAKLTELLRALVALLALVIILMLLVK